MRKTEIRETDLFDSMKSMKNNKTPSNDGLTNDYYQTFWDELNSPLMVSINHVFYIKILRIERSVSACFFKITISFSNANWM